MSIYRRRQRGLLRSLLDLAAFLIVLTATLYFMQRFNVIDLGTSAVAIVDGDSLRRQGQEIRLHGIDAPELAQTCADHQGREFACGREAKNALRSIVGQREVHCTSMETDRFGRAVSTCAIGKLDIAAEMVRLGWAMAYPDSPYAAAERDAKRAGRGIWAGRFEKPADYRARMRATRGSAAEITHESMLMPDD